jgi:type IV pilus assembly protein PilY1
LLDGLPELASATYAGKPFVDGQIAVKAFSGASANQVVLAGALGGGGRGLFVLDVSNPNPATESAAANMILWERSSSDAGFANLGYVYGKPSLTYAQNGSPVLITGNGYNSGESNSAGTAVGDGKAYLMVINATTGALIRSIVADNALGSPSNPNGLSAPRLVDSDLDGKADLAFAGDLAGNLWRFDLVSNTATKLVTADDGKSITMAPAVVKHPYGGYMVTFVTGKLFTDADKADNDTHTAYGIWDQAPAGNTTLLAQTLTERSYTSGATTARVRTATNLAANWATHKGWKTALPMGGERLVGAFVIFA